MQLGLQKIINIAVQAKPSQWMRFSNFVFDFVKFSGPEARGPEKGVPLCSPLTYDKFLYPHKHEVPDHLLH